MNQTTRATIRPRESALGDSASEAITRRIRAGAWLIALTLGALQALEGRHAVGEDGVSYVDIADAYMRGDWPNAINTYWSPFYSWVLGAALRIAQPSRFWESTVVALTNFLLYVAALAAFEFLLRQCLRYRRHLRDRLPGETIGVPDAALRLLAYGIFVWASLKWITVTLVTPDMCLAIFVYLAAGLLLRIARNHASWWTFLLLGGVLGLGYLTKSAMLPLSFVFIGVAAFAVESASRAWPRIAATAAAFGLVALPYVAVMSAAKGRLTTGDTGRLAYAWHANGETDRDRHWNREFPDSERPVHPTTKVLESPALYAFGSPISGTYPPWYAPAYWHEGTEPRFEPRGQLRVLRWSARELWRVFITDGHFLLFGSFVLLFVGFRRWSGLWRELRTCWPLIVLFLSAAAMYSVVRLVPRYVAAFTVLFWLALFMSIRLPDSRYGRRLAWAVSVAILAMIGSRLAPSAAWTAYSLTRSLASGQETKDPYYWRIAQGLRRLGSRAGDAVAVIGYGAPAYWARLAEVRIVGEMFSEEEGFESVPDYERMLLPDGSLKPEAIEAFKKTGAKFIVARRLPDDVARHGWQELGDDTRWYGYPLAQ